jgi:hypothetical protein
MIDLNEAQYLLPEMEQGSPNGTIRFTFGQGKNATVIKNELREAYAQARMQNFSELIRIAKS